MASTNIDEVAVILATESDAALYRNELDEIVRSRICRGNISFRQLCSECKGAFPTEVSAALGRLQIAARFDDTSADGALAIQSDPEPCPVDFEWRFTSSSAKLIADMALAAGKRILCLGTPSVFGAISLRREQAVMTWLVDRNPFFAATFDAGKRFQKRLPGPTHQARFSPKTLKRRVQKL
ncbi:MAG: hypothetical protein DMG92_10720 [Acidobacteria bacterium]|jgi:hypothetical protein|nr:MAG: hypothetical protein DMG92_10720 [Acidobacteriota bacterium]